MPAWLVGRVQAVGLQVCFFGDGHRIRNPRLKNDLGHTANRAGHPAAGAIASIVQTEKWVNGDASPGRPGHRPSLRVLQPFRFGMRNYTWLQVLRGSGAHSASTTMRDSAVPMSQGKTTIMRWKFASPVLLVLWLIQPPGRASGPVGPRHIDELVQLYRHFHSTRNCRSPNVKRRLVSPRSGNRPVSTSPRAWAAQGSSPY